MKGPRKRKRENESKKSGGGGGSITSMFSNMANKKKAEEKISDDDILGDLMSELKENSKDQRKRDAPRTNKFSAKKTQSK